MDRATDCDRRMPVEWLPDVPDFSELRQRIAALTARASSPDPDARLLVEIEDLLAEGYVYALKGDGRSRWLQRRFDALVASAADGSGELERVAREHRMVVEATRELRAELARMRDHWVALGSERLGLA
jgi:hypothetical protein